jgi:hypothetical protein
MKRLILISLLISSNAFAQSFSGGLPIQVANPSVGTVNSASPASATLIGIKDLSGKMIPITVSATGITVNASFNPSSVLNTNRNWTLNSATDSVSAVQSGTWNIGTVSNVSGTIAASQNGSWNINNVTGTVSLPTGAATEATLSTVSGKLPATLGQKAMASSMAVVVASDQSAIPISGSLSGSIYSLPVSASASSVSRVANSLASQTLAALNVNRKGLYLYNDSTANCYVKFGATASLTSFTVKLFSTDTFIMEPPVYTGVVDYICDAASGSMEVNEL